jgi:DNA-binding transcriptional LysR family regulator
MTAPRPRSGDPFDGVTLDHLRVLLTVADEGSFSAAARRLGRVQSAVSQSMATLESLCGFKVWDRSERSVGLTERGRGLVAAARRVLAEVERMRELTAAFQGGLEGRLSLCVDSVFPSQGLVRLAAAFGAAFPGVELRVDTDTLGSVAERVVRRECDLAIAGPLGASHGLSRVAVGSVLMVPVVSKGHALAAVQGRIPTERVAQETQIVLSEHGPGASPDQAVISPRTWRVADLSTKLDFIRGGLGWGNLPWHLVEQEVRAGELVRLSLAAWNDEEHRLPLALVFPPGVRKRPAVRWLLDSVPEICARWGVGLAVTRG